VVSSKNLPLLGTLLFYIKGRSKSGVGISMKKQISTLKKIKIWLLWPFFIVGIISLMIYTQFGEIKALSFILGAMIAIVPNAVFGFSSFRYFGALQSKQIWRSFVRGEVFKIALSVMMFGLVFHYLLINPAWFMLAFILMQFIDFILNCWLLNR